MSRIHCKLQGFWCGGGDPEVTRRWRGPGRRQGRQATITFGYQPKASGKGTGQRPWGRRPDLRATAHAADPSVGPARTHPERQPSGDGFKTAKHHLNPGSNLAKNPPPHRGEVTSLKPLKEKKQAPARRQKTRRSLARTHPERQPPGDGLKQPNTT